MVSPTLDLAGLPALAERRRAPLTELYRRLHRHPELG